MHDTLLILAGGASSRMKLSKETAPLNQNEIEQAATRTKGLISLSNDRPLIDYLLYNAKTAGYKSIVIIVSPDYDLFKKHYGNNIADNNFNGLKISYAIQYMHEGRNKPFGTADAVLQAMDQYPTLKSSNFTVCNSDNLYSCNAFKLLRNLKNSNGLIGYKMKTLEFPKERLAKFAILKTNGNNLEEIIEKPDLDYLKPLEDIENTFISMNIFKFSGSEAYQYFKDCPISEKRDEKEIPSVISNIIRDGGLVEVVPLSEHVPDLTSKDDIYKMKSFINDNYGRLNWSN